MLDHDAQSYDDVAQAFVDKKPVGSFTRDEILDNITLTWLTNTGVSSARLYWENKLGFFDAKGVTVPVAVSTFPREIYPVPRSWAEQAYPNLIYFNAAGEGEPLRGLARAGALLGGAPRGLPVPSLVNVAANVRMPSLGGATGWLNSEPLGPAQLRAELSSSTSGR